MIKDKDLWKHRSWELTIDQLKTKQKRCRKQMWFTFIIWIVFITIGLGSYNIGIVVGGSIWVTMSVMALLVCFAWKYNEMNLCNIIEIRMIKGEKINHE